MTLTDNGKTVNEYTAINEVKAAQPDSEEGIVTTSKGLKLRVSAVPNMAIAEARRKIKPPKVPTYYNKDKETTEENPLDPEYVAAMQDYNTALGTMGATAMLAFGTEVVHRPANVSPPEATDWSDDLKTILDVDVPAGGKGRYAAWLRLYALTDPDLTDVMRAVGRASGIIAEEEVAEAEDAFRDNPERNAAAGVPAGTES